MGTQIIRQPNGRFALWSSVVDDFTYLDCTQQEIVDVFVEAETKRLTDYVQDTINSLNLGGKPYYQFTKSWKEALATRRSIHGEPLPNIKRYERTKRKAHGTTGAGNTGNARRTANSVRRNDAPARQRARQAG